MNVARAARTRAERPRRFSLDLEPARSARACSCTGTATTPRSRSATRARLSAPAPRRRRSTAQRSGASKTGCSTKKPPQYPYPIDSAKAARGAAIYKEYCADCHGAGPRDFTGERVGKVTPIEEIGTDRASAGLLHLRARGEPVDALRGLSTGASRISARPSATPTCRSTGYGCARPTCTTARCRRCGICWSRRRSARRSSIAATTSTIR